MDFGRKDQTDMPDTSSANSSDVAGNLRKRQGIASGLQNLQKSGGLTADLLKEARQRAGAAGVSDKQFDSFLGREGIGVSKSPEQAAQNVMVQREFGTGLGTFQAMQDPSYQLGSGSSLRQPARKIGTKSGDMRRAARRLRKRGYTSQAGQMALAAETQRLSEPDIRRPEDRAMEMAGRMQMGREAQKQQDLQSKYNEYISRLLDKRMSDMDNSGEETRTVPQPIFKA